MWSLMRRGMIRLRRRRMVLGGGVLIWRVWSICSVLRAGLSDETDTVVRLMRIGESVSYVRRVVTRRCGWILLAVFLIGV